MKYNVFGFGNIYIFDKYDLIKKFMKILMLMWIINENLFSINYSHKFFDRIKKILKKKYFLIELKRYL